MSHSLEEQSCDVTGCGQDACYLGADNFKEVVIRIYAGLERDGNEEVRRCVCG